MSKHAEFECVVTLHGKPVSRAEPGKDITNILCKEFLAKFLEFKTSQNKTAQEDFYVV